MIEWVGGCVRGCVCVTWHVHKYKPSGCVDSCCVFVGQVGVCACIFVWVGVGGCRIYQFESSGVYICVCGPSWCVYVCVCVGGWACVAHTQK